VFDVAGMAAVPPQCNEQCDEFDSGMQYGSRGLHDDAGTCFEKTSTVHLEMQKCFLSEEFS
jgi:hypothetical protein